MRLFDNEIISNLIYIDEAAVYKLGNSVVWYIPLGLKNWFLKRGIHNVIELDWWQEVTHENRPDVVIACVPAMVNVNIDAIIFFINNFFFNSIGVDLELRLKKTILYGVVMLSNQKVIKSFFGT